MNEERSKEMKTCKDCLHYLHCAGLTWERVRECRNFTPRNEWVHLPCKAGDTIFMPWEWNGTSGIAQLRTLRVVLTECESYIETDFDSDDYDYFMKYNCGLFWLEDFGAVVFTNKKEAEKALAER